MYYLQIYGFLLPCLLFIFLFLCIDKKQINYLVVINMLIIPIIVGIKILINNMQNIEYTVYSIFLVYMMTIFETDNKYIKFFTFLSVTCSFLITIYKTFYFLL